MTAPASSAVRTDETRRIGRGALYLTATKLWFIAGSYLIYFGITWVAGRQHEGLLGDYKAVGAWLSVISTVLVTGTTQAISRFVGRQPDSWRTTMRRGLVVQVFLGASVATAFFLIAPVIAGEHADLVPPLRIAAAIPLIYALYSVLMGTLNGVRRFGEQASIDASFTTLKVLLVLGGIALWPSASGAYAGFATAAAIVFLLAVAIIRKERPDLPAGHGAAAPAGELIRFQVQTIGFMLVVQWIVQMDLWYVLWWNNGATPNDTLKDLYAGVQLFSQIPYSAVIAVTFVLFPLISAASLREDPAAAGRYVREAFRYALFMVTGIAVALAAAPRQTLALLLPRLDQLLAAAPGSEEALRYLALGYVGFSLFFVLCSVLNAAGYPRPSIALALLVAAVQAAGGAILVPRYGLTGQGIAGLVAMGTGLVAASFVLTKTIGPFLPAATIARVGAAGLAAYALSASWPTPGRFMTLIRVIASGVLFLVLVVALREFTAADRDKFRKILPGGRRG